MSRIVLSILMLALFCMSCTEKVFVDLENPIVKFSVDTIHFDTVFTTIGTSTRELRVINSYNRWLRIERISLAGGTGSPFRINIDGEPATNARNVDLAPGDSIFIFVDVIIDPNGVDNPVSVLDSINFQLGNNMQSVNLLAWGQDIHLVDSEIITTSTWGPGKPWVIYNSALVDTGEVLTIDAGAEILFHRGSSLYVAGTLVVNGNPDNITRFGSDRTETFYRDVPGQWNGIYFINISSGNSINHALIENGTSGIHLGNLGSVDPPPDLILSNSIVRNMTVSGLSSLGGEVEASNCEISHCGFFNLFLAMGGTYSFIHCTIVNLWEYSVRTTPAVLVSDYYDYGGTRYTGILQSSEFGNSVIYGTLNNEIVILPSDAGGNLNCAFNNSLIRINGDNADWENYDLPGSIININPGFISFNNFDFRPDTLSILVGTADPLISAGYPIDIRGFDRLGDDGPDIGAYERQPGENSKK